MLNDIVGLMMTNSWEYHADDVPYIIHHIGTIIYMTLVGRIINSICIQSIKPCRLLLSYRRFVFENIGPCTRRWSHQCNDSDV